MKTKQSHGTMTDTEIFSVPILAVGIVLLGSITAAALTWVFAPPVGGEYWPYIHVTVTLIAGAVTFTGLIQLGILAGFTKSILN